jgi:hypothetical protein
MNYSKNYDFNDDSEPLLQTHIIWCSAMIRLQLRILSFDKLIKSNLRRYSKHAALNTRTMLQLLTVQVPAPAIRRAATKYYLWTTKKTKAYNILSYEKSFCKRLSREVRNSTHCLRNFKWNIDLHIIFA